MPNLDCASIWLSPLSHTEGNAFIAGVILHSIPSIVIYLPAISIRRSYAILLRSSSSCVNSGVVCTLTSASRNLILCIQVRCRSRVWPEFGHMEKRLGQNCEKSHGSCDAVFSIRPFARRRDWLSVPTFHGHDMYSNTKH
jgi:hypothetical protein